MNNNKICFIYCVNDKNLFEESVRYVNSLHIPEGYDIELIAVEDTEVIPEAYNNGMLQSDAKYKVYLHNDVLILDQYFLDKLITLFQKHTNLAMFGIAGSVNVPSNEKWWMGKDVFGKYYDNGLSKINYVEYHDVSMDYKKVKALCNSILVTQYDIPWGKEYKSIYGISQSLEFINNGYDIGVLRQTQPIILLNNSFESGNTIDLANMKKLLNSYDHFLNDEQTSEAKNDLPLVSILIPTYNRPEYFELALQSALNQTYKNIEIIIGDDSTNTETESLIKESYLPFYKNIYYIKNERNLGQFENDINLLKLAKGEYVNLLMDDDLFDHQKIEKMMSYFLDDENKEIKLVTSHRQFINENGELLPDQGVTKKIFNKDTVLDGIQFGDFILKNNFNCIGEPTTALFRKDDLKVPFGTFNGRKYGCNVDTATWLNLISDGKLVYISDTLSYFRIHGSQQLQSEKMLISGAEDYAHSILNARTKGFLIQKEEFIEALENCLKYTQKIFDVLNSSQKNKSLTNLANVIQHLETLLLENKDNFLKHPITNLNEKPLVSVLIPTYNRPVYFEMALKSVLSQTYENIEIIIGDDSTNNETQGLVEDYLNNYSNITYIKNEKNLGQFENDLQLLKLANGEYINFLMDDDLFHQMKIEKMMRYFISEPSVSLVTSHRQLIDSNGNFLNDINSTTKLFKEDTLLNGIAFGNFILNKVSNVIGEPTTVMFKKKDLLEPFGMFEGRRYLCNVDLASWLNLLSKGDIVYISDTLSYFRFHEGQQQQSLEMYVNGLVDFAHQIMNSKNKGFLKNINDYNTALKNFLQYAQSIITQYINLENVMGNKTYLELKNFIQYIELELKDNEDNHRNTKVNLPLVSILIPSYNRPEYLKEALESAINQTYPNIEIIISDDSTNDEVQKVVGLYTNVYKNIRYYKNVNSLGEGNFDRCFELANGEYVNFLNDDDLFHPQKIEKMMDYFLKRDDITLVTSHRQLINESGNFLSDNIATKRLFNRNKIINGIILGDHILKNHVNVIGEPSTVLFRKGDLQECFGHFYGKRLSFINDKATWISLLAKGNAVYLAETLSYTREHKGQNQRNLKYLFLNTKQRVHLLKNVRKYGFLNLESDYKTALNKVLENHVAISQQYINSNNTDIIDDKNETLQSLTFINKQILINDKYNCNYCNHRFNRFIPWPDKYDFPGYIFENYNKLTAICPVCQSMDRERLYKFYIENETNLLFSNQKLLHIAPEKNLRSWLSQYKNIEYICGDLYPTDDLMIKTDITNLTFEENYFDVILCSHVLEHIIDDKLAMQELYRVLKPGGWAILQVPLALNLNATYEDFSIVTEEERLKFFGQEDHVRIYAKDYVTRLQSVGFKVIQYKCVESKYNEEIKRLGLSNRDVLYVVAKQ